MSVRIGVDARRYSATGRGQERYVRCLVHALAAGTADELVVLCAEGSRPTSDLGPHTRLEPAARRLRLQHRRRLGGLRRLLVRDLDLVHFPVADGWYAPVGRTVVTIHDLSVLCYPDVYCRDAPTERRAWRHHLAITATADAVIAVSEATRRDVINLLGVPATRVRVVPHGVEPRFRPVADPVALTAMRRRLGLPASYLLFVGGVDFKKNVASIVEAYALARRRGCLPQVLVLAGPLQETGNPFFEAAQEQAAAAGVERQVLWAGHVSEADLPALYSGADALVFPSLKEGFGLPVLEAMACGTPVVTSAGSAMEEVAGDAGVLVDPHDPASIAAGILDVLDDGGDGVLARAGLRRAAAFTWERTAAATLTVYGSVLAGTVPRVVEAPA